MPSPIPRCGWTVNSRFVRQTEPAQRRLILALDGLEKHGKSEFALTAPGPIVVLNLDTGLDGVIQKHQAKKAIYVVNYEKRNAGPMNDDPPWDVKDWQQSADDFTTALGEARTVIVDTCTEWWEMVRVARFGRVLMVPPVAYPPVNAEFRRLLNRAYSSKANVVFVHKLKEVYDTKIIPSKDGPKEVSIRTGTYERAGFRDMGYIVQVNARMERRVDGFHLVVADCRQNPALAGLDFPEPVANFASLARAVFPDSTEKDWR